MARKKKEKVEVISVHDDDDVFPEYGNYEKKDVRIECGDLFTLTITDMHLYCFCEAELIVKGKKADIEDFGDDDDINPELAPEFGCGNRFFQVWEESPEILKKYNITVEEYDEIGATLQKWLTIGCCDDCR